MKRLIIPALTALTLAVNPAATLAQANCPTRVAPVMPRSAIDGNFEGRVWAQASIKDGVVIGVTILSGPPIFYDAVREAMMQYKCIGQGDDVATQEFNFKIEPTNKTLPAPQSGDVRQADEITRLRAEAIASAQRVRELEEQLKLAPQQTQVGKPLPSRAGRTPQPGIDKGQNSDSGKPDHPAPADPFVQAVAAHTGGDFPRALKLFKTLAAKGDANAQVMLGNMYGSGQGAKQSYAEAIKWYRMAATKRNAFGQYHLGQIYDQGEGVKKDSAEAVKWYRLAAAQGNMVAQHRLGVMLSEGLGVAKDLNEAIKWFQLAADQGNVDAQLTVGGMYLQGLGVAQSFSDAAKWYRMAAEQGNVTAQYALGGLYRLGRGVNQDDTEAFRWFQKAAAQGHAKSMEILADLRDRERAKRDAEARASAQMEAERRRCASVEAALAERRAGADRLEEMYAKKTAPREKVLGLFDPDVLENMSNHQNTGIALAAGGAAARKAQEARMAERIEGQEQINAMRSQIEMARQNSGCN